MFRTKPRRVILVLLLLWFFFIFTGQVDLLFTFMRGDAVFKIFLIGLSPVLIFTGILWIKDTPSS